MSIVIAIIIFGLIIIFHEFGHFAVAKACDVRVNEFNLGFGPRLIHFTKGDTTYSIRLLLFGGSCVMEGEDEESDDERSFQSKPVWQRFLIVAAGPVFNFILAYILSVILIGCIGYDAPVIADVMEGYSAEEQGLQAGDEIISMNGYRIHFYQEVSVYSYFHPGEEMDVVYERDGERYEVTITPTYSEEDGRYLLGIMSSGERTKGNLFTVLAYGFYEIKYQVYVTFQSLGMLISGQLGLSDLSGPVGIVQTIGSTVEASASSGVFYVVMNMLNISILLSANLGVMNLLPIPALDGGRLVFFIIEMIRGKKISEEVEGRINFLGFALLMVLMIVVMVSDFSKILG